MDTLHAITRALNDRDLLGDNTVAVAQRETVRLQQRMNAILTGYMDHEEARLQNRGQGLQALEQGLLWYAELQSRYRPFLNQPPVVEDRTSVVEGKSVSVRLDLGGSRIIKKKKT